MYFCSITSPSSHALPFWPLLLPLDLLPHTMLQLQFMVIQLQLMVRGLFMKMDQLFISMNMPFKMITAE